MKKKFLSYALVASMAVTSVPTTVLADEGNTAAVQAGADENSGEDNGIATYATPTATIDREIIYATINDKGEVVTSGNTTIIITLTGATYGGTLGNWTDVSAWFTTLPTGLIAMFQKASNNTDGTGATIEVMITDDNCNIVK